MRLTPTEWHVLEVLVRNEAKFVPQRQLLQEVWGPNYETETNYLRVYLAQLRRKLEPDPSHPRYLITEPGMGYRFVIEPAVGREARALRDASFRTALAGADIPGIANVLQLSSMWSAAVAERRSAGRSRGRS